LQSIHRLISASESKALKETMSTATDVLRRNSAYAGLSGFQAAAVPAFSSQFGFRVNF